MCALERFPLSSACIIPRCVCLYIKRRRAKLNELAHTDAADFEPLSQRPPANGKKFFSTWDVGDSLTSRLSQLKTCATKTILTLWGAADAVWLRNLFFKKGTKRIAKSAFYICCDGINAWGNPVFLIHGIPSKNILYLNFKHAVFYLYFLSQHFFRTLW
jgi:hypothetical protein